MGIAAIEEMAAQQGVDWVMVELTGVADPGTPICGLKAGRVLKEPNADADRAYCEKLLGE
jgi:G3E family GTPase